MLARMVLLGCLTVTSYRPTPAQTRPACIDRHNCDTANGDGITKYGVAVSQDLLLSGRIKYGDVLYIDGYGYRIVNDCMGKIKHEEGKTIAIQNSIDMLVFTKTEERHIGERHLQVWVVKREQEL